MLDALLALLRGEKVDEVIWTADITYWMAGETQAGRADPAWQTEEGFLALHQDLGILPYYYYKDFWASEYRYDGNVRHSATTRGDTTFTTIETPVGVLSQESVYLVESCCSACAKQMVQSSQDLDVLLYILEHRHLEPVNLAGYHERRKRWRPYDGLPPVGLPRSPLSALCYEWAGVENTVYLMADAGHKVAHVMQAMAEEEARTVDAVCDLAPPLVHFPDNLSSDNLTSLYDLYMAPLHRRRIEKLHRAGVACAVHLDGAVAGLLPKLVEVGFDAVEALTPHPVGDLSARHMADMVESDTFVLWGGVPGALFAPPNTWETMRGHVSAVLECWSDRPFVLGVADQVPPDGDIEFCRRIAHVARDYGG